MLEPCLHTDIYSFTCEKAAVILYLCGHHCGLLYPGRTYRHINNKELCYIYIRKYEMNHQLTLSDQAPKSLDH